MRANNLTISLPNFGCNKNCEYCVSKMTGYLDFNESLYYRNLPKALKVAEAAQVNSVLLTGKGETILPKCFRHLRKVSSMVNVYPLEIQTNGISLLNNSQYMELLYMEGVNVFAISIDSMDQAEEISTIFPRMRELGILIRLTFNITNKWSKFSFEDLLGFCVLHGVDQMSIRNITIPDNCVETEDSFSTQNWIIMNVEDATYNEFVMDMQECVRESGRALTKLSFGATIYDIEGVAVTAFDRCVQESNTSDDIRSLIYQEDGHLYYTWDSVASKIF